MSFNPLDSWEQNYKEKQHPRRTFQTNWSTNYFCMTLPTHVQFLFEWKQSSLWSGHSATDRHKLMWQFCNHTMFCFFPRGSHEVLMGKFKGSIVMFLHSTEYTNPKLLCQIFMSQNPKCWFSWQQLKKIVFGVKLLLASVKNKL